MSSLPSPCRFKDRPGGPLCGVPARGGLCPTHRKAYEATRRPSPSRRGLGRAHRKEREEVLADRVVCEIRLPGCTFWATTLDHVVARASGQPDDGRRMAACSHCNSAKGSRDMEWVRKRRLVT